MGHSILNTILQKRRFYFIFVCFSLFSCDCFQTAEGIVLDKHTGQPISNVTISNKGRFIENTLKTPPFYSDSFGAFKASNFVGGVIKCPEFELIFSKDTYVSKLVKLSSVSKNDTVYLEKVKR